MNYLKLSAMVLTVSAIMPSLLQAYTLSPTGEKFHLRGKISIFVNGLGRGTCDSKWVGHVGQVGRGEIKKFSFTGEKKVCDFNNTQALPAPILITGPNTATIRFGWYYQPKNEFIDCGIATVPININSSGSWSINSTMGVCNVTGTFVSVPAVTIVP